MRFFRRRRFEREMEDELRFHIDACVEDLVRSGVERREAERRARVEFGAVEAKKDECRQAWGFRWMDELRGDLRYTVRALRRSPVFAGVVILSLALGIGANTAIFGVIDLLLIRTLPLKDPGSLVFLQVAGTQGSNGGPPYPCFELLRDRVRGFAGMAAFSASNMEVLLDGGREQIRGLWVSGNFYELLGVRPVAGRALSAADDRTVGKGGPDGPVAVISRAYWEKRFGGDPAVVGRAIRMSDYTVKIVGVMPSELMSLEPGRPIDMAAPMMLSDPAVLRQRGSWWLDIVARLGPGVRVEQAQAEANALYQGFLNESPPTADVRKRLFDHVELTAAGQGMDGLRRRYSKPLLALMALAGLGLLAACVNVAGLLLARGAARQKEFAVRLAIGAGRGRLVRQTLTESLVLVGAGCALGLGIAMRAQEALIAFFAGGTNEIVLDLGWNGRTLGFTAAVSILTGLGFGLLPALRAAGADPAAGFQGGSRSVAGNRQTVRLGRVLVVLQVALSMVLLAGAGLFVGSLRQIEAADRGFTREAALTMEVAPERDLFGKAEWLELQAEALDRIRQIPGVRAASWSTMVPLSGRDRGVVVEVPGFAGSQTERAVHMQSVSAEYFEALGVSLAAGRAFSRGDNGSAPKVAILNETAARFYFGKGNPLGQALRLAIPRGEGDLRIVGVVKDGKHANLRDGAWRFLYVPIPQSSDRIGRVALTVRTAGSAGALAGPVTKTIRDLRRRLLITNVATLEELVARSTSRERLVAALSTGFGLLALALAGIGLYGILAYAVTRRTNEIGIRMALGASSGGVMWLVLREALGLAACGIAVGIPAMIVLAGFSRALLYGVSVYDGASITGAMLILMILAALAGMIPARRASRLDPVSALRAE